MLRSPRRLPQRFNRPVNPQMRRLVESRHKRHRQYAFQRWTRAFQRLQRRAGSLRAMVMQFLALIVSGTLLLMIGFALFSPILHIREIRVQRSDARIDVERIQQSLAPLFGKHLFFLSTQEVQALIKQAVPDLATATIAKEYPATLNLRITLDPIIAQLDIEQPNTIDTASGAALTGSGSQAGSGQIVAPEGSHYLTDEGLYVMYQPSQVKTDSGILLLKVIDWGARPEPWTPMIDTDFLDAMRAAEEQLRTQFGIPVRTRTVYVRAREFHLQTPTYALWFDLRSPLPEQIMRYRMYLQSAGAAAAKEYVDLRLKDKIVYK